MKKIYFGIILSMSLFFLYNYIINSNKKPVFIKKEIILEKNIKEEKIKNDLSLAVERINKKNKKIKSILTENISIKINQKTSINVFGNLFMEKDKNFRLKIFHSFSGMEMDIGSNNEIFWFWSKRMTPPCLYFAKHENIKKTMLKAPLNPMWIMESLGLNYIETKNKEFKKIEDKWAIIEKSVASTGELVKIATLIDSEKDLILGKYLYDNNYNLIASSEIIKNQFDNYGNEVPKEILIIWYEENISMKWNFHKIKVNLEIKEENWQMPFSKNKIEMGI